MSTFVNYVTGSLVFLALLNIIPTGAKVCKSIDVRNHVQNLEKLRNCTEITGDLFIVLLENTKSESDYEPYSFPELQKVTGCVLFYKVKHLVFLGRLFPNLRLIRGLSLLNNFAFIVYDLPNIREIGLSKLSYISRGYVKIGKTPKLCYHNTIDWRALGPNVMVKYQEYREDCPACPAQCNGHCWNQQSCQVFSDSCHEECLGCTKNHSNAHCEVCKNYDNDGICVPECPLGKYTLRMMGSCITAEQCFARNYPQPNQTAPVLKEAWFLYNGECLSKCPEETKYDPKINSCAPCGNSCEKYCRGAILHNEYEIEDLRGCTHINGSLDITDIPTERARDALYRHLRSIRYIRDYLHVFRTKEVEDLQFLPNLMEIAGVKLYNKNNALFVHENINLKKLWNVNRSAALKIKRGNIGFHDNARLCYPEIQAFAQRSGINYSSTDVLPYSNIAYCYTLEKTGLVVNITDVSTNRTTLTWERKHGDDALYYTVHYSHKPPKEDDEQDVCSSNGWETFSTVNNTAQLTNLKVFTTYYFYIITYLKNMQATKSMNNTFKTLPDDPDLPPDFIAQAIDHNSIRLKWYKPIRTNGNLSNYLISIYREDDNPNIIKYRDYCINPFTESGTLTDIDKEELTTTTERLSHEERVKMYELGPPEQSQPDPICEPISQELNINLEDNIWLYLCDRNSQSKYGMDNCKNYYYDFFNNSSNIPLQKRSGVVTSSKKKSSLLLKIGGGVTTLTVDPNVTNYTLNNLHHFSMYVFYLLACNEDFQGRKLCSSVLQATARTMKDPNADVIQDFDVKVVNGFDLMVTWLEPKNPNGVIVAYNVHFRRDLDKAKNQSECISQERFLKERNVTLRNMAPGGYYVSLQAISLAGSANITQAKYVKVVASGFNSLYFIPIVAAIFILAAVIAYLWYSRRKAARFLDNIHLIANINPDYTTFTFNVDDFEMDRDDIELVKMIGQGTFGKVFLGNIISKDQPCAVKTVNEEASNQELIRFLAEAAAMKEFTNGNHVVKLFGVVSRSQPPLVVMELMERGDLKRYLLRLAELSQCISSNEIYRMAIEIADGLAYLTSRKYVHRDLAARNCMISNDKTVKIGDFGLTRDIYQSDYYKKGSGTALLPVRWMAPEAIADGVNTYDSDIWSYGVVLWEIVTLASQPYQGLNNDEVTHFIVNKGTLERPKECPNLLWEIMFRCWDWLPSRRPTSFEIIEILQDHVGRDFKSLSFYHSSAGQEFLSTYARLNNPPAVVISKFRYQNHPASEETDSLNVEEDVEMSSHHDQHRRDVEFVMPSSPRRTHSSSFDVHVEIHEQKPLMTESDSECESQL